LKGLCDKCFDFAERTYWDISKDEISCRENKCSPCGKGDNVFLVKVQIPDCSKGVITKDKNFCSKLLEAVDEIYLRDNR
jgi:ribosomal protein S27AE